MSGGGFASCPRALPAAKATRLRLTTKEGRPVEVHLISAQPLLADYGQVHPAYLGGLSAGGRCQLRPPEKRTAFLLGERKELAERPVHVPSLKQPSQVPTEGIVPYYRATGVR